MTDQERVETQEGPDETPLGREKRIFDEGRRAGHAASKREMDEKVKALKDWLSHQCHDGSLLPVIEKVKELCPFYAKQNQC
jgi:hypothetical protein